MGENIEGESASGKFTHTRLISAALLVTEPPCMEKLNKLRFTKKN
jgi:hypothetical protein